jgi:hypothetical protein
MNMKKIFLVFILLLLVVGCKPDYSGLSEDERCMAACMEEAGLTPGEDCGDGFGVPECEPCVNECFQR